MEIRIKLFGPQAALLERREVVLSLPDAGPTVAEVREALGVAAPALAASLPHSRLAVNHTFADERQAIAANDELALIGMVSGG